MASDSLVIRFEARGLPRRGHAPEEYEDAFAMEAAGGRFAVADGASESAFAGRWAQLLAEEFVRRAEFASGPWSGWLSAAQGRWVAELAGRPLSWYAETKFQEGAFAAFLGLALGPSAWHAVAVGDCCLFHVRQDRLLQSFPLQGVGEFNDTPWLVGSRDAASALAKKEARATGAWSPGDQLWLMTDALALWFLQGVATGRRPWGDLEGLLDSPSRVEAFAGWANASWDSKLLRPDDITLVRIQV